MCVRLLKYFESFLEKAKFYTWFRFEIKVLESRFKQLQKKTPKPETFHFGANAEKKSLESFEKKLDKVRSRAVVHILSLIRDILTQFKGFISSEIDVYYRQQKQASNAKWDHLSLFLFSGQTFFHLINTLFIFMIKDFYWSCNILSNFVHISIIKTKPWLRICSS